MKSGHFASVAAVAFVASVIDAASLPRFGPASCVSVSRSSAGTCVVHTQCAGQDLSNFDISFDCVAKSGRETHSLGIGSFDQEEEYDTDLKCDDCSPPPSNKSVASKPLTKRAKAATAAKASTGVSFAAVSRGSQKKQGITKASRPQAEWFGPDECVGVWRDEDSGNCIMETDCDEETQLSVYEFGLLCVDSNDEMNRHIFGMGSFGHKENFNTQIKCDECLALDEYQDGNKGVEKLTKLVTSMKTQLQTVSMDVQKLNQHVFSAGPAPAPAPAPAPPAKKKFLLSKDSNVVVQSSPPQQTEQAQQAEEEETSVGCSGRRTSSAAAGSAKYTVWRQRGVARVGLHRVRDARGSRKHSSQCRAACQDESIEAGTDGFCCEIQGYHPSSAGHEHAGCIGCRFEECRLKWC
jgi:hypothetical protein